MIKKLTNNISPRLNRTQKLLDAIPKKAHMKFKTVTPIKTGNAKRKTDFNGTDTISGNYNYANRLNEGHSKQARNGMTAPTIDFIRDEVRKVAR
jgi:hypothetical protein|tara:strand:- start:274 stop:555 length:282 start_codon:yes stop_codon:yes gene_type:complete